MVIKNGETRVSWIISPAVCPQRSTTPLLIFGRLDIDKNNRAKIGHLGTIALIALHGEMVHFDWLRIVAC